MSAQILTQDRRVRVFLSSRIPEFTAERKALVRLIKQMGLTPIFFEEIPRPHPPRELYTAYLEQSDLFIGLYGSGYGWVDEETGMTISGVHDEWKLSNGMPRLIFVKDVSESREARLEELLTEIGASGLTFNHFKSVNELVTRARAAIALCLTERFLAQEMQSTPVLPNYIEQVAADLQKHPIVTTRFFAEELQPALTAHSRVFVQGSPGSGKTVALYQLAQNDISTIYLSLRNQSLLSAASYVVIRLALSAGIPVPSLTSAAEALELCESLLKKIPSLLLIDDVDQMPDVAARLSTITPGAGHLVFGGRFVPQAFLQGFHLVQCAGFAEAEAQQYLITALGSLSIQSQTAVGRSHGNPLYLRYYLEAPSADPPASLAAFHAGMWGNLKASEKELIAALALSEVALTLEQIAEVIGAYRGICVTGIAVQTEVQGLGHLVSSHAGQVRLFHPAFRDFVCTELLNAGLAEPIHRHLANAFRKPSELFLHVVHSVRGGMADKVYKHLLRTASWAAITGRIGVSRELLAATLRIARRKHQWLTAGFALHQSADLKQTTRSIPSALLSAQLAEKVLLRSRSKDAALAARITKAVFLIEAGRGDEAEPILKSAMTECKSLGLSHTVAVIRIDLSYLYLRQGRLRECAEECEKAEAVFEDTGDLWGITTAVLNAQNYYVAVYDRPKLIASIKRLLSLAKQLDSPRVEMGAYNGMTVLYRREKKFERAERVCLKAIALAKNLGIWTVEAINTGNLGNIYRDQKRYDKARECYETSLRIAEERSSKHHIAWAKEQLATILAHER
jgi:tetratricopeptide (TPR) repeat protein